MRQKLFRTILFWQGLYYVVTGLWAIVSLESFSVITRHEVHGDAFEMQSIAALAGVLGLFFVWGARRLELRRPAAWLALGSAVAIIVLELVYFSEIRGTLFVPDLFEESFVAVLLGWALLRS